MRRTTAGALCGVLAGTVLLGSGSTMATFSDQETVTVVLGAAGGEGAAAAVGAVALAVQPVSPTAAPANRLSLSVDASVTGAPASLQVTGENAPGEDACGPGAPSVTVSVSGAWLPALRPVQLCDLLDLDRPVVIGAVDASTSPRTGAVVDIRFDGPAGAAPSRDWAGTLTFTLVQGASGPRATATVPARVEAGEQSAPAAEPVRAAEDGLPEDGVPQDDVPEAESTAQDVE